MSRQNLARRFPQSDSADCENSNRGIEDYSDRENNPAGNDADSSTLDEGVKVTRRQRREIDFQVPAQRQQRKDPEIVAAQAATDGFRFKSIVLGVVSSDAFRKREGS